MIHLFCHLLNVFLTTAFYYFAIPGLIYPLKATCFPALHGILLVCEISFTGFSSLNTCHHVFSFFCSPPSPSPSPTMNKLRCCFFFLQTQCVSLPGETLVTYVYISKPKLAFYFNYAINSHHFRNIH